MHSQPSMICASDIFAATLLGARTNTIYTPSCAPAFPRREKADFIEQIKRDRNSYEDHGSPLASQNPLNMRGCSTCRILSAGHRLFVRKFSAPTASSNLEWCEVFEGIFGNSLPSRPTGNQSVEPATFLIDIFQKSVHGKAVGRKPANQELSKEELQFLDDAGLPQVFEHLIDAVGLPQVFEHLIEELSVDHAVLLCTRLPANYLETGINTLLTVLVERVQRNDIKDQGVLADKIFELIKHSKGRNCILSEESSQKLLVWVLNSGDALMCTNALQLLCKESIDLPQAKDAKERMKKHLGDSNYVDSSCFLENKYRTLSTKGLSKLLDKTDLIDPSCKTRALTAFYCLGKSISIGRGKDNSLDFQELQLKGVPKDDLGELIDSFTKGLTVVHPNSRDIRKGVEAFKKITRSLKSDTVASFNMLIAFCGNHGEIDLCIDLIQTMKVRGLEPCASSYEPLIKFFARTLEISKAEDILQIMRLSGMRASAKAHESLILAHAKVHNFERAYNLIEDIPHEDLTADLYTPIIHAYGIKEQVSLALSVFSQMKRRKVKPNGENFASLIRACAIRNHVKGAEKVFELYKKQGKFSDDEHKGVMAAMLRVYAGCGDFVQLEKMISCTDENVLDAREVKSALLKGFATTGRNEEALKIYNEIRSGGGWPESGAFLTLLCSVGKAGNLDQLLALFEPFRQSTQGKSRVLQEELMSLSCCTIVHAFISHNNLEGALEFLQKAQLEDAGDVETLCLKVFVEDKGHLVISNRVHLALKDKLQFLRAMREKLNIQPTRLAYESLLESCAKEKDVQHAEAILDMMRSDNLQLNVFTYLIMLRIVISKGDLQRATFLLSEMKETMESNGLMDKHVKYIIKNILNSGNADPLMDIIYPRSRISIC